MPSRRALLRPLIPLLAAVASPGHAQDTDGWPEWLEDAMARELIYSVDAGALDGKPCLALEWFYTVGEAAGLIKIRAAANFARDAEGDSNIVRSISSLIPVTPDSLNESDATSVSWSTADSARPG